MGMGTEKCLGVAKLWTACPQSLVQVEAAGEVWIGWGVVPGEGGHLIGTATANQRRFISPRAFEHTMAWCRRA